MGCGDGHSQVGRGLQEEREGEEREGEKLVLGFCTEVVLGLVPALHRRGLAVRLLTGRCEPEWLRAKLTPSEAAVCVWSLSLSLFALN